MADEQKTETVTELMNNGSINVYSVVTRKYLSETFYKGFIEHIRQDIKERFKEYPGIEAFITEQLILESIKKAYRPDDRDGTAARDVTRHAVEALRETLPQTLPLVSCIEIVGAPRFHWRVVREYGLIKMSTHLPRDWRELLKYAHAAGDGQAKLAEINAPSVEIKWIKFHYACHASAWALVASDKLGERLNAPHNEVELFEKFQEIQAWALEMSEVACKLAPNGGFEL